LHAVFASAIKRRDSAINRVTFNLMLAKAESNVKTRTGVSDIPVRTRAVTEMRPAIAELVKNNA